MLPIADDYYLVLSAGRTGTVFLAESLSEQFPDILAEHEPRPSRWEHFRGNVRQRFGGAGERLRERVFHARAAKLASLPEGTKYIELNPLLCPLTDLLVGLGKRLHIVHLVREPSSWTDSILKFKASGTFRHIIDAIPFALPYPRPFPQGWRTLSLAEKTLWRWRFCNEAIFDLKRHCETYTLVRFEDLFHVDESVRDPALEQFLRGLSIDPPENSDWFFSRERKNAAPLKKTNPVIDPNRVKAICSPLSEKFGYKSHSESHSEALC